MRRMISSLATATALAFVASAASAQCIGSHKQVTASKADEKVVVMSKADDPAPVRSSERKEAAPVVVAQTCPEGEKDCLPATE